MNRVDTLVLEIFKFRSIVVVMALLERVFFVLGTIIWTALAFWCKKQQLAAAAALALSCKMKMERGDDVF